MAYRDDLDGLAHQRARDDEQAALLAAFRRGERSRGRRAIAAWLGGLVVVGAIYGVSLAGPMPRRHRARHVVSPQSIALRIAADFEYAAAKQRARARRAMQTYLSALDADPPVSLIAMPPIVIHDLGYNPDPAASQGMQPLNPSDFDDLITAAALGRR